MWSDGSRTRFAVVPSLSAVVIEARSNVGSIMFGAPNLTGEIVAPLVDGAIDGARATARLEVRVDELSSGNNLYDSELRRRIDARRFPRSFVTLQSAEPKLGPDRFTVSGAIEFHGVRRTLAGEVTVALDDRPRLLVTGEQHFDIREFEMSMPTMLMIKIDPVVRVRLHVEAEVASSDSEGAD